MQTRRDHMQAYQFAMGRLATALVSGDPGRGDSPTKRSALGTFFGAGLVVLMCVGFLIYGKLSPVTTAAWRQTGSIIVEKETGNRYLYLDGVLRPVRNYASALLLTGKGGTVRTVAAAALDNVPRGAPVGIDAAPDSLPSPASLLSAQWSECLRPDLASGQVIDFAPEGRTAAFPADRQALLKSPGGKEYVLWQGVKYPVPSAASLIALGLDGNRPLRASAKWLAAVPTGMPLAPTAIPGTGRPAGQVGGQPARVGDLFTTSAAGSGHFYVMTSGGVAQVSASEAALMAARPRTAAPHRVLVSDIASARLATGQTPGAFLPELLNAPATPSGQVVCLREKYEGAAVKTTLAIESGLAATASQRVLVPPSRGVYAVEQGGKRASKPQTYLISDRGIAYPLGDASAAQSLGLGSAKQVPLPTRLLAALPHGPLLDHAAARETVQQGTGTEGTRGVTTPSPTGGVKGSSDGGHTPGAGSNASASGSGSAGGVQSSVAPLPSSRPSTQGG